jgi:hypothetical protein
MTGTNKPPRPSALDEFRRMIQIETDECVVWLRGLTSSGYGNVMDQGKSLSTHRTALELRVGAPPSQGMHAAHSCSNKACINYRHLRWATPKENAADLALEGRSRVGESNPRSKLTADEVQVIRRSPRGFSGRLAEIYGVKRTHICDIQSGRYWLRPSAALDAK